MIHKATSENPVTSSTGQPDTNAGQVFDRGKLQVGF